MCGLLLCLTQNNCIVIRKATNGSSGDVRVRSDFSLNVQSKRVYMEMMHKCIVTSAYVPVS